MEEAPHKPTCRAAPLLPHALSPDLGYMCPESPIQAAREVALTEGAMTVGPGRAFPTWVTSGDRSGVGKGGGISLRTQFSQLGRSAVSRPDSRPVLSLGPSLLTGEANTGPSSFMIFRLSSPGFLTGPTACWGQETPFSMLRRMGGCTGWGRGERRQEASTVGLALPLRGSVCTKSFSLSFCTWISFLSQAPILVDAEKLAELFPGEWATGVIISIISVLGACVLALPRSECRLCHSCVGSKVTALLLLSQAQVRCKVPLPGHAG